MIGNPDWCLLLWRPTAIRGGARLCRRCGGCRRPFAVAVEFARHLHRARHRGRRSRAPPAIVFFSWARWRLRRASPAATVFAGATSLQLMRW